jgi:mRNA-degrading endonuclease RelE of RelBE toxin-antitoxin system
VTVRIRITDRYRKAARRIPAYVREKAIQTLEEFIVDPGRPGLRFERLAGWDSMFSIRVTRGYRILLMQEADGVFAVVDIGSHEVYRR